MNQILQIREVKSIKSSVHLFENIQKINIDYTQENFIVIFLNTKKEIIDSEVVFKGGLNACLIDPKTIFRKALIKNSAKIILAHNHPSKCLEPSEEDRQINEVLTDAGKLLDLKVLDSIIFNEKEFYSFGERE
jgi:DNA repair protein RadC